MQLDYKAVQRLQLHKCDLLLTHYPRVDPDSPLFEDMKKLRSAEGTDHLLFHLVFDDKFPYTPPFVRLVRPVVNGGYVLAGGAICMELLTPQVSTASPSIGGLV